MCGLFAMLSGGRAPPAEATVDTALDALAHRGPDGRGRWCDGDAGVALGHARLALVGLADGAQPLASEDGRVRVVVNGEFYGHRRVRRALEARGHRFATASDSEILVHLWEEHGPDCLAQLEGEFAFAVWDAPRRTLFAARDRFGAKPLHWARHGGALLIASEAKALFAAGVPARWDHESFFQFSHFNLVAGRTLFAGIRQVAPGHLLRSNGGAPVEHCYWDLDYPRRDAPVAAFTPEEHVARTREALEEAVRVRLDADVPVGCYLSGGLDSSVLLGIAARLATRPVQAFTVAFDDAAFDESAVAEASARAAGVEHHILRVTPDDIADRLEAAVWHSETINPNTNGAAKLALSAAVRGAGLKAVLTGEGADEVAAGYDFLVRDAMAGMDGARRRTRGLAALGGPGIPSEAGGPGLASVRRRLGAVPSWLSWFAEASVHARAFWSPAFAGRVAGRDPYDTLLETIDPDQLAGREPMHQSLYLWNKSMFPSLLLTQLGDRAEMASGIEGRLPFLDTRLFSVLRDVPTSMLVRGGRGKHVLREAARPFVTDQVYRRRKQAFLAPPPSTRRISRLDTLLHDILRSGIMASVPFFEHRKILRLLDSDVAARSPTLQAGLGDQIVFLASADILQDQFKLS